MFFNKNIPLLIFILSLINGLFYSFFFENALFADATQYDILARNILKGHFSLSLEAPYLPTMEREPIYPFFLSIIYKIFGYNYYAVYLIQVFIFSLISLLTFYLAKNIFNHKIAIISGFLVALLPTLANYTGFILSELFFTFVLICSIFFLQLSLKKNNKNLFFISGISLGLSVLIKAYMLLFIIMIIIYMIYKYYNLKFNLFLNAIALISGFLLILSFWSYRNFHKFDTFEISGRGGLSLWMAADQLDDSYRMIGKNIVFNFSEYLGSKIFKESFERPNSVILTRANNYHARIRELELVGYSPMIPINKRDILTRHEIEKKMTEEAIDKIIKSPITYTLQRFLEFEKMLSFLYIPSLNLLDIDYHIKNNKTKNIYFQNLDFGNLLLALIKFPFKILGYIFFIMSIYAIVKLRKNFNDIYLLIAIIFYTNFIYSLLFGLGRYGVPLIPYYIILSSWILSEFFKNKKFF